MGTRRLFPALVALGSAGLLVSIFALAVYRQEPTVDGRKLSQWADQYGTNKWGTGNSQGVSEAESAIRKLGAEAVPVFLEWLRTEDSVLKTGLRKVVPAQWHARLGSLVQDKGGNWRRRGAHGLSASGTNASTAVPKLIELAREHPDEDGRYIAVFAIRTLGPTAEPAIPFLVQCLTNSSWMIRDDAALGLGYLQLRPELAIPALTEHLDRAARSTPLFELQDTIQSLGRFQTNAVVAVPKLTQFLDHGDPEVRRNATNALRLIEPSLSYGPQLPAAR